MRPGRGDHPRSRGVYPSRERTRRSSSGSSPLARGLPHRGRRRHRLRRIIPARAGFTPASGAGRRGSPDHPRSRGVYPACRQMDTCTPGSSPLARGLPAGGRRWWCAWRIIPARAGFTHADPHRSPGSGDHPRSRGVYALPAWRTLSRRGSSPLARGLRRAGQRGGDVGRIIPARAGFTWFEKGDIPVLAGSSPLARGLPHPVPEPGP